MRIKPNQAVIACVLFGAASIVLAVCYSTDKGSVAIAGAGALGQVIVAVLLYYLTREQLDHARSEAAYRKVEQKIAKQERILGNRLRIMASYGNSKTRIGKTRCDKDQVERLRHLCDDMRQVFQQPVSQNFNRMCDHAEAACALTVGEASYMKEIAAFDAQGVAVYEETKRQIIETNSALSTLQGELEAL